MFYLRPLQFEFLAKKSVYFPDGKAANIIRSALGSTLKQISCVPECTDVKTCPLLGDCVYARLFEPTGYGPGPSGLIDRPRPFVIRAANLDGYTVPPGCTFKLGINLFDLHPHAPLHLIRAFARLAEYGLGPGHGAVELIRASIVNENGECMQDLYCEGQIQKFEALARLGLTLDEIVQKVHSVRAEFLTPTELKGEGAAAGSAPSFSLLFARIRDRVSNLRLFYGEGPLEIDFAGLGSEAGKVEVREFSLRHAATQRFSMSKRQSHPIGGFMGSVTYAGELSKFIPYLGAARWTGVGKHTVWGNGEMIFKILE